MKNPATHPIGAACVFVFLLALLPGNAQTVSRGLDPETQRELKYANALMKMGMPDYADEVLKTIKDPAAKVYLKVLNLRVSLARGKFDEAKAVIEREPDQRSQTVWAMKLALADAYYNYGKYNDARAIYEGFFKEYPEGPTKTLNEFYTESAYKYAQMLLLMGLEKEAIQAYENVLKADLERHARRQIMSEMAELMLKTAETLDPAQRKVYFDKIGKITETILWQRDLWFGKAIVMMAHMKLIEGDITGAMGLVEEYKADLVAIDEQLKRNVGADGEDLSRLSPMAECRYLVGVILQDRAEKLLADKGNQNKRDKALVLLTGKEVVEESGRKRRRAGALQHFINVFVRYPNTPWAADAGARVTKLKDFLDKEFGIKIAYEVSDEQMETVKRAAFQNARALYNQQRFEEAVEYYIKILTLFPEGGTSVAALGELARCYIEQGGEEQELYAETVINYLGERFGKNQEVMARAGNELLRTANLYEERKMADRRDATYNVFLDHVPEHLRTPETLFRLGDELLEVENFATAESYYQRVADQYPDSRLYQDALSKVAYCQAKDGRHEQEIETLKRYTAEVARKKANVLGLAEGKYRLAYAHQQAGNQSNKVHAINLHNEVIKLLSEAQALTGAEKKKADEIAAGAWFLKGLAYTRLEGDDEKVKGYLERGAVRSFETLVSLYPDSIYAPKALSQVGTTWTLLEEPLKVQQAIKRLEEQYPGTPEADNSKFLVAKSLLEMDRRTQATKIFVEMFKGQGEYTPAQLMTAGNELSQAGEYEIALQAFEKVAGQVQRGAIQERALGAKGEALVELERYDEAIAVLKTLLDTYGGSKSVLVAYEQLSRAYAEKAALEEDSAKRIGLFNEAVAAMKELRRYAEEPRQTESTLGVARIRALRAEAEKKFGTPAGRQAALMEAIAAYQALILFADPNAPGIRPVIEQAYYECIPAIMEVERWQDVIDNCDQYEETFPMGTHLLDVGKWRNRARLKLATGSAGRAQETGSTPEK